MHQKSISYKSLKQVQIYDKGGLYSAYAIRKRITQPEFITPKEKQGQIK